VLCANFYNELELDSALTKRMNVMTSVRQVYDLFLPLEFWHVDTMEYF